MQGSKDFIKKNNIVPFISFKDQARHQVKLLSDEIGQLKGIDGKDVEGVKYVVEENGEKKSFFTSSISLIQKLSVFNPGDEVVVEMKSRKDGNSWKSYFVVSKVGDEPPSVTEEEIIGE